MGYQVKYLVLNTGKIPYQDFVSKLKDPETVAIFDARIASLRKGDLGDFDNVKKGVLELRIHPGPGYRIFCGKEGQEVMILISAIKKPKKKKQDAAIAKAQKLWKEYLDGQHDTSD